MKAQHYTYGTVGRLLEKLPCSARIKARRNVVKYRGQIGLKSRGHIGLSCLFAWSQTPEGRDYWGRINHKYYGGLS